MWIRNLHWETKCVRRFPERIGTLQGSYAILEQQYDPVGRAYKASNPHNSSAQYWTTTQFDGLGPPDQNHGSQLVDLLWYCGSTLYRSEPLLTSETVRDSFATVVNRRWC